MADTENTVMETSAEPAVSVPPSQPAPSAADPSASDLLKQLLEQNQKQTKYLKKIKNLLVLCLICLLISALVGVFVAYKVVPPAVTLLNSANDQVLAIDMQGINSLIGETSTAISGLQQALNSINGIDFGSLNEAITSLKNIASSFDIDKLNGAIDALNDSVLSFGQMVERMNTFKLFG